MKIAIDLHGTINNDPAWFRLLCMDHYFLFDNEIWVMSGPEEKQIRSDLKALGFVSGAHYTGIYSVVDFLKSKKVDMWQDEGDNWWTDDNIWWRSKSIMCTEYDIDILIDDKTQYQEYFIASHRTKFILYNEKKEIIKC